MIVNCLFTIILKFFLFATMNIFTYFLHEENIFLNMS